MKFRTEIQLTKSELDITHQSKILMLGSCFTSSIGKRLIDNKFNVLANPFGTLYNPISIQKALEVLIEEKIFTEEDTFFDQSLYNSFYFHSSFSNTNQENFIETINKSTENASKRLNEADILFITFGTAYVYEHLQTKEVVGNCHKLPSSDFKRYRLSVESIIGEWNNLLDKLETTNPKLQIIFTVSPIRHLRDGTQDNQLSKATLLLAIEGLNKRFNNTHYFPSYEIVLDDLRDYRFYEQDMCHPNALAIDYIWIIFKEAYLTGEGEKIIEEWKKIEQALNHRSFNPESDEHTHFLKQTLLKLNNFGAKYPYLCLDREQSDLERRIKK